MKTQTLVATAYSEDVRNWETDLQDLLLLKAEKIDEIQKASMLLKNEKWIYRFKSKILRKPTPCEEKILKLESELRDINKRYNYMIKIKPKKEAYELALIGNKLFYPGIL